MKRGVSLFFPMHRVVPFLRHIQKDFKFDSKLTAEQREEKLYNAIFSARSKESVNSNASTIELELANEGKSGLGDLTDDDSIRGYKSDNSSSAMLSKSTYLGRTSKGGKLRRRRRQRKPGSKSKIKAQRGQTSLEANDESIEEYMLSDEYILNLQTSSSRSQRYVLTYVFYLNY